MSLYMIFEYKVSKRRMEQAVLRARLEKTEEGYLFDLGQGPLVDLLSGSLEDLADAIGHFLDDDFSEERGKHDPAELLPFIRALRDALEEKGEQILSAIHYPLQFGSARSLDLLKADLDDFQVFCEFGARINLPFRHTFA